MDCRTPMGTPAASTTTSAPVRHIMLASASAGETVPAAWWDPLLAVSAGEAWVALGEPGSDSAGFIGRLAAGEWTRYEVTGGIVMGVALAPDGVVLVTDLCSHDQGWARENCGDLWLGFDPQELGGWAQEAGLADSASVYLAQRNGFQIQVRLFRRA